MKPTLFPSTYTMFGSLGLGVLDCVSCKVAEVLNGEYELAMTISPNAPHFNEIAQRMLIYTKVSPWSDDKQPFRIYKITKPYKGLCAIYARHISYDQSGIPVSPFTASGAADAMSKVKTFSEVTNRYTFTTDMTASGSMTNDTVQSARSVLGLITKTYGGEIEWGISNIYLRASRGLNRGVSIRYGKNLTNLQQDENCENVYTGIIPFFITDENTVIGDVYNAPGTYDYVKILPVDMTREFERDEIPTKADLAEKAAEYIAENDIGTPEVSLEVSFVELSKSDNYADYAILERVQLGDTVQVVFPKLNVSATAKVNKTVYDVIKDRWESIDLGSYRTDFVDRTQVGDDEAVQTALNDVGSVLSPAIARATAAITGASGGNMRNIYDANGNWIEQVCMNTQDILTATKVWRWNIGGFGYSNHGYDGPFGTAITMDGEIVADYITTGTLNAALVNVTNIDASNITTGSMEVGLISGLSAVATSGDYSDLSGAPDLQGYVSKDGVIGSQPSAGATGFVVSSAGLLQASNVVVYGTIYATAGTIGGFTLSGGSLVSTYAEIDPDGIVGFGPGSGAYNKPVRIVYTSNSSEFYAEIDEALLGQENGSMLSFNSGELDVYGDTYFMDLGPQSHTACRFSSSGEIGYYTSSIRYKEHVETIAGLDALALVQQMRPVTFTIKKEQRESAGLIAEELFRILPRAVPMAEWNGISVPESVDTDMLIPYLIGSIQNLADRLEVLERGIA